MAFHAVTDGSVYEITTLTTPFVNAEEVDAIDHRPRISRKHEEHISTIATSIDVNVPVRTAYNQWTQFEEFPCFMEEVKEAHQLDDRRLHWKAKIAGKEKEWETEIIEHRVERQEAGEAGY